MTSQLAPTPITDKNGKQTTVYKRTSGAPKKNMPSPVLAASVGTPLRLPKPLKEHESWAWVTSTYVDSTKHVMPDAEALDPATKAIAKDLGDREIFTHRAMGSLIGAMDASVRGGTNSAMEHNFLLVAEKLCLSGLILSSIENPQCHSLVRSLWGTYFLDTPGKRKPTTKVTTQEELDSLAALTYATHYWESKGNEEIIQPWYPNNPTTRRKDLVYTLRNKNLAALIRERPEEVERVIAYVEERGSDLFPINDLRDYLDATEGTPSLADGWL